MSRSDIFDVAIVGYGPAGQVAAGLLGQRGLKVYVCERLPEVYEIPRAISLDHEIMRVFQQLGVVEAIDPQPVEGIRATGARPIEEIVYGVIPQVMPLWISYSLYRFEANVRSASVVGMVGAGGIGMVLWDVIRGFQYAETAAVLLMLVVTVSVIDVLSSALRTRLI